MTQFSFDNSH